MNRKQNNKYETVLIITLFVFLIGIFVGALLSIENPIKNSKLEKTIGEEICQKNGNMTFISYRKGTVYCKEKEIKKQINGIEIKIEE